MQIHTTRGKTGSIFSLCPPRKRGRENQNGAAACRARERERCPSRWINKLMAESAAAALSLSLQARHREIYYRRHQRLALRSIKRNKSPTGAVNVAGYYTIHIRNETARDEIRSPRCRRNVDCTEMKRRAHAFSSFGSYSLIPRIQLDQKDEEFEKTVKEARTSFRLSFSQKKKKKMATGRWLFPP